MKLVERMKEAARADVKRIVLPEGDEPRTVKAAAILKNEGIAEPILLTKALIEAPSNAARLASYAATLYELRKAKGLTEEKAAALAADPMYYGMLAVKAGEADGLVSGAIHSTGDMLRPALQVIRTAPGMKLVSSSFLVECPNRSVGEEGLLVLADGVVNPCPTAEELAHIAVATAETARKLCGVEEPRVAMLSFSTKGSAEHALVEKVREATAIAKGLAPALLIDGELQLDASDRRRTSARCGARAGSGRAEGAGESRGGARQRTHFPRPSVGEHRLQDRPASRRRVVLCGAAGSGASVQRSFARLLRRRHREHGGRHGASGPVGERLPAAHFRLRCFLV